MFTWFKKSSTQTKPKTLGQLGEEFAQGEYKKRGYKIIAANFFNKKGLRLGEVDFIAANKSEVIFVEVKARVSSTGKFGSGAEAVDIYKQRKILKAVKVFLQKNPKYLSLQPKIDVCVMEYSEIDKAFKSAIIIPNAVEDFQ